MAKQMKHLKTSLETTDDGNEDNRQQIYAKNSMDRFGDDLYTLLVSHLHIEDMFQLECVSKQFQRTVFRSVVDIDFDDQFIQRQDFPIFTTMNKIIKKCRNIQTIDFIDIEENNEYFLEVLPEILHKFPNLRQIYCNLSLNSNRWIGHLAPLITRNCQKQWPRLQVLSIRCQYFNGQCLDHISRLPALQKLVIYHNWKNDLSDDDFEDLLSRSIKLKNIKIHVNNEKKFYCK
ncbi:unnamed protein product [Medioppia subpectinata]|uniref:F-box domain-containing protein n=1 Tax=Medioppia subpectinata TaxID=1979941 RepID=A0A7R9PVE3_9ACAR|nr:unnamed protein product [Medioppia subpectinata]CAG2101739.1 unnamed protein product [Medioppia subpectinata]